MLDEQLKRSLRLLMVDIADTADVADSLFREMRPLGSLGEVTLETAHQFVRQVVSEKVDLVATDESGVYARLSKDGLPHKTVNHARGEYARGNVHNQTIDDFWSPLKRCIMGIFQNVSAKCLPLYVTEFEWRYNNRTTQDIFGAAIARC
jgi:hypothetical protein